MVEAKRSLQSSGQEMTCSLTAATGKEENDGCELKCS